ncbi:acyltransferase family protein [Photobacterium leiognathi]|uniref:acyltransferase family protein n=1 Tax=Photobacterium leiognathi TaxID=553611 RepID=UPI002982026F|nr:acyltransferase [Photobacterium leiognathi]
MEKRRFEALDAFRGLCALAVVMYHLLLVGSITEFHFFRGSFIFVEFFFVLSGFVLAHGYGFRENLKFLPFMEARFFRLYPLHLFMFLVFFVLELAKLIAYKTGGFIFSNEPFTNFFSLREIIPNLLLIQSWVPFAKHLSFNAPSWSISVEFYMYALLFLSVIIFKSYKILSWGFISIIAFIALYLELYFPTLSVLRGVSCFFGGATIYSLYRLFSDKIKVSFVIGTLLESILILCVYFNVSYGFEYKEIVTPLLFCLVVLFFSFEFGGISYILKSKVPQLIGKLSYSIYMTHYAIIFCLTSIAMVGKKLTGIEMVKTIGGSRTLDFGSTINNNLVVIFILFIVISVSNLTYKYIELKGQELYKKKT